MLATTAVAACFFINNTTNRAAHRLNGKVSYYSYTDYGDNLGYNKPIPKVLWPAVREAEAKLRVSPPGRKIARACI